MLAKLYRNKILDLKNINVLLLALFGFTMPFSRVLNVSAILMVLALFTSFILWSKTKKKYRFKTNSLLSMIVFFLVVAISLIYSEDIKIGMKEIVKLTPFIMFPIIYILNSNIKTKQLNTILNFYVIGTILAVLYCFVVAIIFFEDYPLALSNGFSYFTKPLKFHPSYFAIYIIFAFSIYVYYYNSAVQKQKYTFGAVWIITLLLIVFLKSRAPLIAFMLITVVIIFRKAKWRVLILATIFIILFIYRHDVLVLISGNRTIDVTIDERFNIWINSIEVIKNNLLLGVGIGDSQIYIDRQYYIGGFGKGILHRYNSHNQFLQTLVSNGLFGFLSLIVVFIAVLVKSIKEKSLLLVNFIICTVILMLFDSVLILQHGVYFFTFFTALFLSTNIEKNEN